MSTQNTDTTPKLTKKDFSSDQDVKWCPGCGDYSILAQIHHAVAEPIEELDPSRGSGQRPDHQMGRDADSPVTLVDASTGTVQKSKRLFVLHIDSDLLQNRQGSLVKRLRPLTRRKS